MKLCTELLSIFCFLALFVETQAGKIDAVLEAAHVSVEKYWPIFFARFLENHDITEFLSAAAAPGM